MCLMCLTSYDNFKYQSQFVDTENITHWDQRDQCQNYWSMLGFFFQTWQYLDYSCITYNPSD